MKWCTRNAVLWASYDFANSFVFIAFYLYFSEWAVVDRGISDLSLNLCFAAASVLLLIATPFVGTWLDARPRHIAGLRAVSVATFLSYLITAIAATHNSDTLALVAFTVGQFSYALSFAFYLPLLRMIAPPNMRGRVSGLGMMGNFLGNLGALTLAAPLAAGAWHIWDGNDRAETLLPCTIAFFIFSLPMLILFRERRESGTHYASVSSDLISGVRAFFSNRTILFFVCGFILFGGAIYAVSINFPILLERLWHVSDHLKTLILAATIASSAIGGVVGGTLADRLGEKRILVAILLLWTILLPASALVPTLPLYILITIFVGFLYGAYLAVVRAIMAELALANYPALSFAFFNAFERTSIFVGPILWGTTVTGLAAHGESAYRVALFIMTALIVCGLLIIVRPHQVTKK